jgi:hypothetical protein
MVIGYVPRCAREIKYPEPHKYGNFACIRDQSNRE